MLAADGAAAGHWPTSHGVGGPIGTAQIWFATTTQTRIAILNL